MCELEFHASYFEVMLISFSLYAYYSQEKKQHGGGGGKGKWNDLDDGTLDAMHTSDVVGEAVQDDAL